MRNGSVPLGFHTFDFNHDHQLPDRRITPFHEVFNIHPHRRCLRQFGLVGQPPLSPFGAQGSSRGVA